MRDSSTGQVTFLFTDIEGSTRLWEQQPDAMRVSLQEHDALLHKCISANNGHVFKTVGDAFCAAFSEPSNAINAAIESQLALMAMRSASGSEPIIKVRMAIHT